MLIRLLFCFSLLLILAGIIDVQCNHYAEQQAKEQELTTFTKAPLTYDPLNNPTSNFNPPEDDHE
jgi:hypothetical protein